MMKYLSMIFLYVILSISICANAQKTNDEVYEKAAAVIDYLLNEAQSHNHHHHSKIAEDTKLVNVEIEDKKVNFYIEMSLNVFEDDYYEMLYEELGLRMFNVLSTDLNLTSFEVLLKNEVGEYTALSKFVTSIKDEPYSYPNNDKGEGGAAINLSK